MFRCCLHHLLHSTYDITKNEIFVFVVVLTNCEFLWCRENWKDAIAMLDTDRCGEFFKQSMNSQWKGKYTDCIYVYLISSTESVMNVSLQTFRKEYCPDASFHYGSWRCGETKTSSVKTKNISKQSLLWHSRQSNLLSICLSLLTSLFVYKGPDFVWHIDGYDKLKPYGFTIHGCVDGLAHLIYNC